MPTHKCFIFGLDNAGKTTLAHFIKEEEVKEDTSPTLTFNIDQLVIKDIEFIFWDAPGQVHYRKRWVRGVLDAKILIFILDTSDSSRFKEAKNELDVVLDNLDTRGIPLIVCFHKIDLEISQQNYEKAYQILLLSPIEEREVHYIKTSVYKSDGVEELKNLLVRLIEKERWG